MTNPGLPSSMSTKDDDQESIDLGQLNIRSYRVPILGGPLIALVLMEKFDLKFAVKWFFGFSIMPGGCGGVAVPVLWLCRVPRIKPSLNHI